MKLLPQSFVGWVFIFIFMFAQIASDPNTFLERIYFDENFFVLFLDYLVFPLITGYLLYFLFANIYNLFKPNSKKTFNSEKLTSNKSKTLEVLEKELEQLEEIEKINLLKEQINEKRKSLNLNSKEHFDAIVKNIEISNQKINQLNEKYLIITKDKKFYLQFSFIYGFLFLGFIYISFYSTLFFYVLFCGILILIYLVRKHSNCTKTQNELYENIQIEKLKLKDLKIEKTKNEL